MTSKKPINTEEILRIIRKTPNCTISKLGSLLGVSIPRASIMTSLLEGDGKVAFERIGMAKVLHVLPLKEEKHEQKK